MTGTTAAASRLASELLATHAEQVEQLTPGLMRDVARRLGRLDVPADSQWPGLVTELLRDFFDVLVADDLQRIDAPGSIYERVGTGAAGAGISADDLAVGIRLSAVRTQAQVHRFVLAGATPADPEAVVGLLARVVAAGEAVVVAALRGHALAAGDGESVQARRLGELLVAGAPGAGDLAALVGWPAGTHVSAVVVAPEDADRLRGRGDLPFARHERERDVVLVWREQRVVGEGVPGCPPLRRLRARRRHPAPPTDRGGIGWVFVDFTKDDYYARPRRVALLRRLASHLDCGLDPARLAAIEQSRELPGAPVRRCGA